MKGNGGLYRQSKSPFWWMTYSLRGQKFRESTKVVAVDGPGSEAAEREAYKVLRKRLREVGADLIGAREFIAPKNEKITVNQILDDLVDDYKVRDKLTAQVLSHLKPLRAELGNHPAVKLVDSDLKRYIQTLRERGKKKATINRSTQLLGQAYRLAGKTVGTGPRIVKLSEADNVRRGFLDPEDFEQFVIFLPDDIQDFVRWGFVTGWRKSTISRLEWTMFDMRARMMDVPGTITKNGEPLKIALRGALAEIIDRRWATRTYKRKDGTTAISNLVFYRERGLPVADFDKAWKKATEAAGLGKILFHDLRRSAVRNLRREGIDETVAMKWTGHRTQSIFKRYNIVDERDLENAVDRLNAYLESRKTEVAKVVAINQYDRGMTNRESYQENQSKRRNRQVIDNAKNREAD
jgi:integrase